MLRRKSKVVRMEGFKDRRIVQKKGRNWRRRKGGKERWKKEEGKGMEVLKIES